MKMFATTLIVFLSTTVAQAHPVHQLHMHLTAASDSALPLPAPLFVVGFVVAWAIGLKFLDCAALWRRRFGA